MQNDYKRKLNNLREKNEIINFKSHTTIFN